MQSRPRVAIVGIGGVGGFLGSRLAARYAESGEAEIIFKVRGENAAAIRSKGLRLITTTGEEVTYPAVVAENAEDMGIVDVLICCMKAYDLETSMEQLQGCVDRHTVILPFLNGLEASNRIRERMPRARVWEGCAYIIAALAQPGIVRVASGMRQFYFGGANYLDSEMSALHAIFTGAGIDAHLSNNMTQVLWEKFIFISPFATITSCLNLSIGDILGNDRYSDLLAKMSGEVMAVAAAAGVPFGPAIIDNMMNKYRALPPQATSSMHNDFKN